MGRTCDRRPAAACAALMMVVAAAILTAPSISLAQDWTGSTFCQTHEPLCAENHFNYQNGKHIGHDEPSLLFYSNTPGSGNSAIYNLTLPKDPPKLPKQDGSGGAFNFQLHVAFWFGMAMCDTQSFPEFTGTCVADSDTNIFDNSDPNANDFIGKHPGTAFMEMQFYPPGWVRWEDGFTSCDGKHWCAALNIDSFNFNAAVEDGDNNADCLNKVGEEPVNFAFVTKSGVADIPANPLFPQLVLPNLQNDLLMNPGDNLTLDMHDTADGFEVVIYDNTTHQRGSMKASIANGFAQVNFAPNDSTCTSTPYAFHPMYSTSGVHTRVPWTAHSYNIAFSDEIGHWDYCDSVALDGTCTEPGHTAPDDVGCFLASSSSRVKVGGCIASDFDFDGTSYNPNWPGTNPGTDKKFHPAPISFSSAMFNPSTAGSLANYDMTAFEADMPIIEPTDVCDTITGIGCTNPPAEAFFYPFYSIGNEKSGACTWRFGGANIVGSTNTFGGVSQYGDLLSLVFPSASTAVTRFDDFRSTPASNPCDAQPPSVTVPSKPISFGKVAVGKTSRIKALKLANRSAFPITLGLGLPSDYQIAIGRKTTCPNPGVLPPGGKCQYGLTLTPSAVGPDNGVATISSNASNATATVNLAGTGK